MYFHLKMQINYYNRKDMVNIYLYSDARFSKKHNQGVIGFMLFLGDEDHNANNFNRAQIETRPFNLSSNVQGEFRAMIEGFKTVKKQIEDLCTEDPNIERTDIQIIAFTDSEAIFKIQKRRKKLEASNFISKKKNTPLSNTDIYKEFYLIFDQIKPQINWLKGHCRNQDKTFKDKNFSYLDQKVRKALRSIIKNTS